MKKSASLVAETVDLLSEVLGEAKLVYKDETFFVPDWVAAEMFKSQKDWATQATAKSRARAQKAGGGKVPKTYTPGTKKAVLPPSLEASFQKMDSEIKRDLAVIYYENQNMLDSFIASRTEFPKSGAGTWMPEKVESPAGAEVEPESGAGAQATNVGLTKEVIDQVYALETRGRSDVVGKGEALALLYWKNGQAADGTATSTATIDLVLSGKEVSVKAYEGLSAASKDIKLDFKVNGTLTSFKEIAEAKLKSINPGAHNAFTSIWSKNINQEVIFTAALESGATQEQFKALVDSLDYGVREMKGSGSTGDYVYLVVSRNGWLVIDKKSPDLNFGGITEGKVSVNYRRVTDLRTAADGSTANFNNMVKAKTSPIAKAENALLTAYNSLEGMGSIDDTTNIAELKKRIGNVKDKLDAYKSILGSDKEAQTTRPGVLASISANDNRLVKAITGALAALQGYRAKAKDDVKKNARVGYEAAMRPLFGSANMINFPPSPGSDAVEEIDGFITNVLLARSVDRVSESRRRKPRRTEASMGGVLGSQVPMGRGPDGKPDRRTSNAILRKNGTTQARYFGGGSIVEETRELLLDLLDD